MKKMGKFIVFVLIMCGYVIAFCGGMYVVATVDNPKQEKETIIASVKYAMRSTDNQPIVVIVPKHSLLEKVSLKVLDPSQRNIVFLETTRIQSILEEVTPEVPGMPTRAWKSSKDTVVESYNWWKYLFTS